jgi:hypothetical protein
MRDPTREEQCSMGVRQIGWTKMGIGKVVADMVKRHDDHH